MNVISQRLTPVFESLGLEVVEKHHGKERTLRVGGAVGEGREPERFPLTRSHTIPQGPASGSQLGLHKHCPEQIQILTTPSPCLRTQSRERIATALKMILAKTVNSLLTWRIRFLKN